MKYSLYEGTEQLISGFSSGIYFKSLLDSFERILGLISTTHFYHKLGLFAQIIVLTIHSLPMFILQFLRISCSTPMPFLDYLLQDSSFLPLSAIQLNLIQ